MSPRTFEDALVYANYETLGDLKGSSTGKKIQKIIEDGATGPDLEQQLFELIDKADKASFALDCLIQIEDPTALVPPPYIEDGLRWLEKKLDDSCAGSTVNDAPSQPGAPAEAFSG